MILSNEKLLVMLLHAHYWHKCFKQVADVKKVIESMQDQASYPADQQVLIHQGKVLKDDTTLEENQVIENNFLVIMLRQVGYAFVILVDTWARQTTGESYYQDMTK